MSGELDLERSIRYQIIRNKVVEEKWCAVFE